MSDLEFKTVTEYVTDVYFKDTDASPLAIVSSRRPVIQKDMRTSFLEISTTEEEYMFPEFEIQFLRIAKQERQVPADPVVETPEPAPVSQTRDEELFTDLSHLVYPGSVRITI